MSKKVFILVVFLCVCSFFDISKLTCKAKSYNLALQDAFLTYLPDRLRSLVSYVKQHGISNSIKFVQEDRDLDSYLFILDAQVPYKLLAYSRTSKLVNKIAADVQKYLVDQKNSDTEPVSLIFDSIISTAQKGDTFIAYKFQFDPDNPLKYQVAYVHWFTYKSKNYVLGAALFVDEVPDYFIITHRVKTVAARIKKEGIEKIAPLLAYDQDPDNYFFISQRKYPYRQIVNGGTDKFLRKSAQELQQIVFPHCEDPVICDLSVWYQRIDKIILPGTGFYAYLWPAETGYSLKIGYMCPIDQDKHQYFLASGVRLRNVPKNLHEILSKRVDRYLALIDSIGLENAITVGHEENTPDAYVFITKLEPPYEQLLHLKREMEGKSMSDAQAIWEAPYQNKKSVDYMAVMNQEFGIVRDGGGFYAYPWQSIEENPKTYLKVSFSKPFTYAGKSYYLGSGYLIR